MHMWRNTALCKKEHICFLYIWSKMLSSSVDTLLKVSKTTSPKKLFDYDCVTLYEYTVYKQSLVDFLRINLDKYIIFKWCFKHIHTFASNVRGESCQKLKWRNNLYWYKVLCNGCKVRDEISEAFHICFIDEPIIRISNKPIKKCMLTSNKGLEFFYFFIFF